MAGHYQRSSYRYPNLRVTVKHETDERFVHEVVARPKTHQHNTTVYYNTNHHRMNSNNNKRRSKKSDRQEIRPLMEIQANQYPIYTEFNYTYTFKPKSQSNNQYRNRKAELDWDHAFDLDQIELYSTRIDSDNYSLTSSTHSSNDNSFSSD